MRKTLVIGFVLLVVLVYGSRAYKRAAAEQSLIYFIPSQGAENVSPFTSLAIRQGSPLAADAAETNLFIVTGSQSGVHTGKTVLSDDQLTLLFYPDEPFVYGETVTAMIQAGLKTADNTPISETSYQFTISEQPPLEISGMEYWEGDLGASTAVKSPSGGQGPYYTHPEFTNIMTTTVTTPAQNTEEGYVFVAAIPQFYDGQAAMMIVDNEGEPIYIRTAPDDHFVGDFRKQTVSSVDYLTYHAGILPGNWTYGSSYVLDESYQVIDTWTISNGLGADVHEFLLLDNGHAILMAYMPIPYDLTPYGGPANGALLEIILQEQDANKNVVFEWHATEHLPIDDTEANLNTTDPIDFLHTNGIAVDNDGNWLITSRNFSEITKINRQTGDVIWRMGGQGNEFTFTNDIGFINQHSINRQDNGHITLFDNGTYHSPPHSRALEYEVDEINKTVTRVWMYPSDTSIYAPVMGNIQRLPNGNSMISWGNTSKLSEVESDGTLAFEMLIGSFTYRAFRHTWNGVPAEPPRAVLQYDADPTAVTIYTSWNGATDIVSYDVFAGPTPGSLAMVDNAARSGFETEISLTGLPNDTCFFQVQPVHSQGDPTPYSNMMFRLDLQVCWDQLSHAYLPATYK